MYLKQLEVGMMKNFNYLIGDPATHECAWVDPAWEVDRLLKIAKADGYQVKKILLTHNHFDHVGGVEELVKVTAIHTPGHTPGSTCYLIDDRHLVTGDTLFQGNCGRCDLPGGSPKKLFESLQQLRSLEPATKVYPGHDYGRVPVTTIGYEKEHNPTMQAKYFREFVEIP